jgi:uncharacterized protein DUF5047
MLPGGLDTAYRQALATPHTEYVRVDVLDGAGNELPIPADRVGEDGGLQFIEGTVAATLTNRVTRNLELTVDESLYPTFAGAILAPYGNRLRVWRGIKFAEGTVYRWVVFTGRIQDDLNAVDGQVSISAMDRANEVVEAQFVRPENSQVGSLVSDEFIRLVSDGVPDARFGTFDLNDITVPQLTWESDRAGALDEMATSSGAYWWALADGSYVIRAYPFARSAPSLLTLSDGPGGTVAASPARAREQIFNSVTVTGERVDGTAPVFALAQDLNPASPTYVRGNFGLRHKTINLQTPQTQGSCQSAANSYLRTSVALTESWTWTQPVDAALELGDVVTLNARGESGIIQVVSGFVIPLGVSAMTVTARAQVPGLLGVS